MDPRPFTMRRLKAMYDAKQEYDWEHTAALRWQIWRMNSDPKKGKQLKPDDFHPMRAGKNDLPPMTAEQKRRALGIDKIVEVKAHADNAVTSGGSEEGDGSEGTAT